MCCNCKSSILKTGPISAALSCKNLFSIQQRGTLASSSIVACNAKPPIQKTSALACQNINSQNLPTPVHPTKLNNLLLGYDSQKLQYLIDGFMHGFHLGYTGPPLSSISKNHKSTYNFPSVISDFISEGITINRIAGPFSSSPINILFHLP